MKYEALPKFLVLSLRKRTKSVISMGAALIVGMTMTACCTAAPKTPEQPVKPVADEQPPPPPAPPKPSPTSKPSPAPKPSPTPKPPAPSKPTVRVAVFSGPGADYWGGLRHAKLASHIAGAKVFRINAKMVGEGMLDQTDVLVVPGGKATVMLRNMGADVRRRIAAFVRNGGGFIGTCAGCYVATGPIRGHRDRLGLIPFTSGAYGGGVDMPVEFTQEAQKLCGLKAKIQPIAFHGGPVLDRARPVKDTDVRVIAYYRPNFGPKSRFARMANRPAIVAGRCGKGHVFASAVHPEKDPKDHYVLRAAYNYVLQRQLRWK